MPFTSYLDPPRDCDFPCLFPCLFSMAKPCRESSALCVPLECGEGYRVPLRLFRSLGPELSHQAAQCDTLIYLVMENQTVAAFRGGYSHFRRKIVVGDGFFGL